MTFHDRARERTLPSSQAAGGSMWDATCTLSDPAPSATTATSRHGWVGFVYCCRSWLTAQGGLEVLGEHRAPAVSRGLLPPCRPQRRWIEKGEAEKMHAAPRGAQGRASCVERIHMLNATYIWYSSIASTNCPHESKSVPFLKLACHFWTVLLTSDMLAGRILAALSGQHSRGGDSSTRQRR